MANDLVRVIEEGEDLTGQVTAAVTGKRFLRVSAARNHKFNVLGTTTTGSDNNYKVAHAGAGQRVLGVSKYDQPAIGGKVGIARGGVCPVTAGAALLAGQEVQSDANGQAIPWDGTVASRPAGIAMDDALVATDAEILVYD